MKTSVLEIKGLIKHYKKFTLGPIDLQVEQGTVVAVVGPNGSGKSTLFRIIMKLLQTEQGSVKVFGQNYAEKEAEIKQKIGFVGDHLDILGHLTIRELASLIAYWYPTWDDERYFELLKRYNIDDSIKYEKTSKGNQKKIQFVFSIAHNPELLILDELSAGVDLVSQRKMREDLMNYLEDGQKSILMATHLANEIKRFCDYIYVLNQGKLSCSLEKDEIQEKWARLWVSEVPAAIKNHPNVRDISQPPLRIVTDNLNVIENELIKEKITVTHIQRLDVDEVLEYLIDTTS